MQPTRRNFLQSATRTAVGLTLADPGTKTAAKAVHGRLSAAHGFVDLHREPDAITIQVVTGEQRLTRQAGGRWTGAGSLVTTNERADSLRVSLSAPKTAVKRLHLRWRGDTSDTRLIVGDAWERGYGDLEWRAWVPDRVMPWYVATYGGEFTHGYGVRTGCGALCFWQVDPQGVSLWADVRSGGVGVQLGQRTLEVCDVVCRPGRAGESSFAAIHAFCRQMCANPRLPLEPVYGSNDWYWAYGRNSATTVLADARQIVELSPPGANRPFVVIDDGWQPGRGADKTGAGAWDRGNEKFPDLPGLAAAVRSAGARPGIWIRPLQAAADAPDGWRLQREHASLDPTAPDVRDKVIADITRVRGWGFDLIKHDYTTFDVFGRWGYQMGAAVTREGWMFAEGSTRTTAEVISELYGAIRRAAGGSLVIGCNTVSHLSAGHFEICRVGDDTSGTDWSRTRKMGVNTLAFRAAQHGAFYAADADCVGVTNAVPWIYNRQWLDLLARSGTMLFVSIAPDALTAGRRRDLANALTLATTPHPLAEPLDWQTTVYPSRWRLMDRERTYDWVGPDGADLPRDAG